ncbi:putative MAPEG superfamily protein [Rubricella aquisinus]|uniref:Putative MAPEG superfamily protein n=1 Tax=Rubricella aquisinus TaxID=2028108 RepID=A0A840WIG8_9RHOB|nr:MAPEG family protein [Rubricella aquisinus]MBB5514291.1 putative MAPEG superfamily protein [Rubricella aquisinus]
MTTEMISLLVFLATFAALLIAQPLLLARAKGMAYVTGNRADSVDADVPVAGRLARTVRNSIEAAVLFVPLVLATEVLGTSNALTHWGAVIFVAARVAYALLYPLGIVGLRTLAWNAGFAALAAMAFGLVSG